MKGARGMLTPHGFLANETSPCPLNSTPKVRHKTFGVFYV